MRLYKNDKSRYITGLIIIIIIYSANFIFFVENEDYSPQPLIQHLIKLLIIGSVYFSGTIHLKKLNKNKIWMNNIWQILFLLGLSFIIISGLVDWFIIKINPELKQFVFSIEELLISPLLYAVLGLLHNIYFKNIL